MSTHNSIPSENIFQNYGEIKVFLGKKNSEITLSAELNLKYILKITSGRKKVMLDRILTLDREIKSSINGINENKNTI